MGEILRMPGGLTRCCYQLTFSQLIASRCSICFELLGPMYMTCAVLSQYSPHIGLRRHRTCSPSVREHCGEQPPNSYLVSLSPTPRPQIF